MDKIIQPFINLANANMVALVRCFQSSMEFPGQQQAGQQLWRSSMENQASFVREYSRELFAFMTRNQSRMSREMEKLSEHSRHVARQMTHGAVRAMAIAAQARQERAERRVFTLPLRNERRTGANDDRRLAFPAQEHHA
ncbi:MAG: hypothetical protein ACM3X0_02490 [Bacteroidota bacterium]